MEAGLTIRIRLALLYSGGMLYMSSRTWERRRYQNCRLLIQTQRDAMSWGCLPTQGLPTSRNTNDNKSTPRGRGGDATFGRGCSGECWQRLEVELGENGSVIPKSKGRPR